MRRLLTAEVHRWRARRGMWITLGAGVLLCLMIGLSFVLGARPPIQADVAQGQEAFSQAHADWAANHQQMYDDCLNSTRDKAMCEQVSAEPIEDQYVPHALRFTEALESAAGGAGTLGPLLALIAAASFWGAEYRHATLGTWLTFAPDRTRVWLAKFVVVLAAGVALTAATVAVLFGIAAASVVAWQGLGAASGDVRPALGAAARGLGLGAMAGLLGGALAVLFRQTVAAVLVPLGYSILQGLSMLFAALPFYADLVRWFPENNVRAYLEGGTILQVPKVSFTPNGPDTSFVEVSIGFGQGLAYLLVALGALVALSWWSFRRRDVA